MKKTLSALFTMLLLLCLSAIGANAYTLDTDTKLPKLTQAPEIYYIANDATSYGDYVRVNYINSEEIIEMQREITVLGEEEYLKKHGFDISTEEDSYDYASVEFYVQFAYSFDKVNWINDSNYEEENDTYWLPTSLYDYDTSKYIHPQLPNTSSTSEWYDYVRLFDLTYLTDFYYEGYHSDIASNMTQGNAFRTNANDEDTGYSINFNNKTLYVKARYRVWYYTSVGSQREYNVFYSPWSSTVSYNNSSKGLTYNLPAKGSSKEAPVIKHIETEKNSETSFDYRISIDYPDKLKKAAAAADAAYHNVDDTYDIFSDNDYYYYSNLQIELKVNNGKWYEYTRYSPAYNNRELENEYITEFFEDKGIDYEQGDTVYLRARILIGNYSYGDYGIVPNDGTYLVSQYSQSIVLPLDGYYRINYVLNSGSFDYDAEILRQFTEDSTQVVDLTQEDYIPTRYGYKFEGWYSTSDFRKGTKVTSINTTAEKNHTLYAKWSATEYNVTYVAGTKRYVYNNNPSVVTTYMNDEELNTPTCSGLTFLGWYTSPDFKESTKVTSIKCSKLTGDITLYMKWNIPTYNITYVLNGGKNAAGNPTKFTVDIEDETDYINIKAPTKTGMIFDGWYYYEDFTGALTKTDNGYNMHRYGHDITLYAKWIKARYTITYVQPKALKNVYNPNPTQYTYGDTVTLKKLSETGYTFGGWYTDSKFTKAASKISSTDTGKKTFYAKWTENVYKITYVHDTIEELAPPASKIKNTNPDTRLYTQKVTLTKPYTGDGIFEFVGWYNNVNFQGKQVTEIPANTAAHTTLYAKWFVYQWGDANLDGKVSSADARLALRHAVGLEKLTGAAFHWANISYNDNVINSGDARSILRIAVGLDTVKSLGLPEKPPALNKK